MKNANTLDWSSIEWKPFQILSLHLAQNIHRSYSFEEYLKQGNFQDGVDIVSSCLNGKQVTIQCKCVKGISQSSIDTIVNDFIAGAFVRTTERFIIALTADCQSESLQKRINYHRANLHSKCSIQFDCWDVNFFNEQLRNHYSLVEFFWGKDFADAHCFRKHITSLPVNEEVEDYIPRYVSHLKDEKPASFYEWYYLRWEAFDILKLFNSNRLISKQLCIVGDAYQGKSTLLRNIAFQLEKEHDRYKCIFLELKLYPNIKIEEILDSNFAAWRQVPAKDLVIFLDGIDEVPTDEFLSWCKTIKFFFKSFDFLNIVFSCRKIFYYDYSVANILPEFDVLEVAPLEHHHIHAFIERKLGHEKYKRFTRQSSNHSTTELLFNPFYLRCLIQEFTRTGKVPQSINEVLEKVIDESFIRSHGRQISSGRLVKLDIPLKESTKFRG